MGRHKTVEFYDKKEYKRRYAEKLSQDPERQEELKRRKRIRDKKDNKRRNDWKWRKREKLAWMFCGRKPTTAGRVLHEELRKAQLEIFAGEGANDTFKFVYRGQVRFEMLPYPDPEKELPLTENKPAR